MAFTQTKETSSGSLSTKLGPDGSIFHIPLKDIKGHLARRISRGKKPHTEKKVKHKKVGNKRKTRKVLFSSPHFSISVVVVAMVVSQKLHD